MSQLRVDTIGSLVPVAAAFLAATIGVLSYRVGSDRLDFAAHFVAGLGGTMLLLSVLSVLSIRRKSPPRGWPVLALTAASCLIGVGCEALFFVGGGFDLVDVSNQSLGAVTAGLIFATWPVRGLRSILVWDLLALILVAGGAKLVELF